MLVVCEKNKTRVFQPSKGDVLTGNHFMLIVSAQSKASPVDLVPLLRYPYTILQMSTHALIIILDTHKTHVAWRTTARFAASIIVTWPATCPPKSR